MMKRLQVLFLSLMALSTSLIAGCDGMQKPPQVTKDAEFAIEYKYTSCGTEPIYIFNSKESKFYYQPLGSKDVFIRDLAFSNTEMGSIFQKTMDIGFINYPHIFKAGEAECNVSPVSSYELTISNGNFSNIVDWSDKWTICYNTQQSMNLRQLERLIYNIMYKYFPQMALPIPRSGCL